MANLVPRPPSPVTRPATRAFSMVELLVTMTLLSLIVLALMAVFNSTQQAFRASVTQTDVLEGSRATMDLITTDLRGLTPCDGVSNYIVLNNGRYYYGGVNFFATNNDAVYFGAYAPLRQSLPGTSSPNTLRTNLLQWFFMLGRENTRWTGAGYVVNSGSAAPLYPLYRYYAETNIGADPRALFVNFANDIYYAQWTNLSHVMDGVVHLVVRAYDPQGYQITNKFTRLNAGQLTPYYKNIWFSLPQWGETGFYMFSNVVPASVELQLGVLEDRPLARAESLPFQSVVQSNYLSQQAGRIHLLRQRVTIPNVDPSAYP